VNDTVYDALGAVGQLDTVAATTRLGLLVAGGWELGGNVGHMSERSDSVEWSIVARRRRTLARPVWACHY